MARDKARIMKEHEQILEKAATVLGSRQVAERWIKEPARGLNRRRPLDLLSTAAGREKVNTYLCQIEHGVYI